VAVLLRFSLVDRVERGEETLWVHRLVQAVTRDELGDERRPQLAAAVVEWVCGAFAYKPLETPISSVPEGIAEQVMAVGMLEVCVAARGRSVTLVLASLGYYRLLRGMLVAGRAACERSLEVAEGLAKADPDSAQAQRDLSVSLNKLGKVEVEAGNLAAARELFQRSRDIAEGLAKADPHSAQAAFDVNSSHQCLAQVAEQQGDRDAELHHLRAAKAVLDAMEAKGQYRGYATFERARRYIDDHLP
jgi:hypothetical protein